MTPRYTPASTGGHSRVEQHEIDTERRSLVVGHDQRLGEPQREACRRAELNDLAGRLDQIGRGVAADPGPCRDSGRHHPTDRSRPAAAAYDQSEGPGSPEPCRAHASGQLARLEDERVEPGLLREVEGTGERVGSFVAIGHRLEAVQLLDELQHRRELIDVVVDGAAFGIVAPACVRRDDQGRCTGAEPHDVVVRRRHMVVEAAEVVPDDDHGRVGPRVAALDRVQVLDRPVLPLAHVGARTRVLVRLSLGRDQPRDRGQRVLLEILQDRLGILHLVPHGAEAHVPDRLQGVHPLVRERVVLPADAVVLELVGQHLDVEAGARALPVLRDLEQLTGRRRDVLFEPHDALDVIGGEVLERESLRELGVVVAVVPFDVRRRLVVDDAVALGRDRVEVLGERRAVHRREEVVGDHEAVGIRPVRRQGIAVVLGVSGEVLAERDAVEAVHLAAVDREQTRVERVAQVVRLHERSIAQLDGRAASLKVEQSRVSPFVAPSTPGYLPK